MAISKEPNEAAKPQDNSLNNDSSFEELRAKVLEEIDNVDPDVKLFATRSIKTEFDGTIENGKV